ncbi:MAG: magnesium/cobalt efflux protein, partial [Pseudomonadales bacterium]|nr:magnesium/cobalt efflux protein [Pseudomonadales bacterium]
MGESEVGESPNSRSWLERVAQVFSGEPTSRNELRAIIQDAADRALLDAEALGIIDGAMAVSEMQARDIMVPRASVVFVRAEESPEEFLPTVIESQHSRFPVIGEDFDDVRGVLHAKDLLPLALTRNLEQ